MILNPPECDKGMLMVLTTIRKDKPYRSSPCSVMRLHVPSLVGGDRGPETEKGLKGQFGKSSKESRAKGTWTTFSTKSASGWQPFTFSNKF